MAGKAESANGRAHREIKTIIVALVVGSCSIVMAGAFRDAFDAVLQMTVPVNERALGTGAYLFLWRFFYFLIALALLILLSILLV
jgi:H+/Cl- antiporter ClcA